MNDKDHLIYPESSIWCKLLQEQDWKQGKRSCCYFGKYYKWMHLLALFYNKKLNKYLISNTAKQVALGQKRRKGVPPKAKKALIRQ